MNISIQSIKMGGKHTVITKKQAEAINPEAIATWDFETSADVTPADEIDASQRATAAGLYGANGGKDDDAINAFKGLVIGRKVVKDFAEREKQIPYSILVELGRVLLEGDDPTQEEIDALKKPASTSTPST